MPIKRIPDPEFAGDDGSVDPRLTAALLAHAADPARLPEVLAALHHVRVLAPVVALLGEPGHVGQSGTGAPLEKTSEIALPLLLDADGHRAVPVFSCLATMAAWDRSARPVPAAGPRAAAVALAEGAAGLVLDLAGPSAVTLGLPEVRALAEGRAAVPAYDDERLAAAVALVLAAEPSVVGGWIAPGVGVDAMLTIALAPATEALTATVGARLAQRLRGPVLHPGSVRGIDVTIQAGRPPEPPGRPVFIRPLS